jgi:hypothetical protein
MIFLTLGALMITLLSGAVGNNVTKFKASVTYFFLWAVVSIMLLRKAKQASLNLWAHCPIMTNFIALETNNIIFKVSKIILIFNVISYFICFF